MREQKKVGPVLTTTQVTFLFILILVVLVGTFTSGVYVGLQMQTKNRPSEQTVTASLQAGQADTSNGEAPATAQVAVPTIDAPPPTTPPSEVPTEPELRDTKFVVQVATPTSAEEAQSLVTQLRRDGFKQSYSRAPQPNSVSQLYSVEVGPFNSAEAAEAVSVQLRGKGLMQVRVTEALISKPAETISQTTP